MSEPSPAVIAVDEQSAIAIDLDRWAALAAVALRSQGVPAGECNLLFVDDETIHVLNREHLDHDWPTDCISFDYGDDPAPDGLRGEVVASAETARREALERGKSPRHELLLYVVHGVLHLQGHDHIEEHEAEAMEAREREILARFDYPDPYQPRD